MFPSVLRVALFSLQLAVVLPKPVSQHLALMDLLGKRDSVAPPILEPSAKTVWKVGDTVTVTWNVTALNGAVPSNPLGKVFIGYMANPDDSEHLDVDHPLAQGFQILSGSVSFVVPSLPSRDNYIVCLYGNSGNISPTFSIVGSGTRAVSSESTTSSVTTFTGSPAPTDVPTPSLPSVIDPNKPTGNVTLPHPINSTATSTDPTSSTPTAPITSGDPAGTPTTTVVNGTTSTIVPISATANGTNAPPSQTTTPSGALAFIVDRSTLFLSVVCGALLAGSLLL